MLFMTSSAFLKDSIVPEKQYDGYCNGSGSCACTRTKITKDRFAEEIVYEFVDCCGITWVAGFFGSFEFIARRSADETSEKNGHAVTIPFRFDDLQGDFLFKVFCADTSFSHSNSQPSLCRTNSNCTTNPN